MLQKSLKPRNWRQTQRNFRRHIREIGIGDDDDDAGHRKGGGRNDFGYAGMRVGAAQDRGMSQPIQHHIADIFRAAGQETFVFHASERFPDKFFTGRHDAPPVSLSN